MNSERGIHASSVLLSLIMLSYFTIKFSLAASTLFPNQTLHDGQSLISANKTFELGFFSPTGSNNRYVGIWYHNVPGQTVVWVANRDNPKLDSSGFITIDSNGNLMILDSIGTTYSIASNTGSTNLTSATLLDSGNLIFEASTGSRAGQILWQSFDHPTDNFLPGMKLGLNGQQNRFVTSWKSPGDPGTGDFQLGINPNGTKQFLAWKRRQVYWTSGVWNGKYFDLFPSMMYYHHNFSYSVNWSDGYYSYSFTPSSIISRTLIDYSGQVKQLTWLDGAWVVSWAEPKNFPCEVPTFCGANGLCNNHTSPSCACLSGFKPGSEQQWGSGNWSGGCARDSQMTCGDGDTFSRSTSVKLPLFLSNMRNYSLSLEDCHAECLIDCSCTAYASANGNGSGCLLWFGDLIGLQEKYDGVQDLYVRTGPGQSSDDGRKRVLSIVIPSSAAVIILLSAVTCYFFRRKCIPIGKETSQELLLLEIGSTPAFSNQLSEKLKHIEGENDPKCSLYSFTTIVAATNNFSPSNKLGEGGFGPVYKGMLEGQAIAAKRLSISSGQGVEEFKNEITLIANLQHRNLVRLLGCCIERAEKILIYEFMPNKSLDLYIYDPVRRAQLDWTKRFRIIEGIAQGILYLHMYSRLKVIHRDLKASNILLDSEMNPKISDFGLARIFAQDEDQANTIRVVGTYGYMSPEYAIGGQFSVKSDVYSFGVLVLEIVSGRKNALFRHSDNSTNLPGYAWQLWKEGKLMELIDHTLVDVHSWSKILRCIQVALLSVQDNPSDRPTMSKVISMLSNESPLLLTPKEPVFSSVRTDRKEDWPSSGKDIYTPNEVTFTTIEGR